MEKKPTLEKRMLAAILFTDIQGFSQKMNRRESVGLRLLQSHNDVMDAAVQKHGGRVVKSIGDSYMVTFDSVVNAVEGALEAQKEFQNTPSGGHEKLLVRISIHLGDVVLRGEDVFGDGVNMASHLQQVTPGGSIYVSPEVYSQVRGKISARFRNLGFCRIKGLSEPIEIYEVFQKSISDHPVTPPASHPFTAVITTRKPFWKKIWLIGGAIVLSLFSLAFVYFRH